MHRRDLVKAGLAMSAIGLTPRLASAQATYTPMPKGWRTYLLTTRVEPTGGATRAWIPLPTFEAADWQRPEKLRSLLWVEPFVELKTLWHPVAQ